MNIETRIREGRMSAYQVSTIVICMIAIVSDGYDILATALTMPAMTQEWAIDPLLQGYVISGSTAGMVIGSVGLAPLGDRFGRRPLSVVGQALITVGMVGAWLAPSYEVMLAARVLTGVGIGVVTAVMAVIAAEYATRRALGFTMALYSAGTGLGGFLAGLIAGQAIGAYGWKSMFLIGAVVNAVILVLCATSLPESVQYLAKGTRTDSLDRLNRLMRRMRRDPLETLPRRAEGEREESLWGTLRQLMSKRLLTMSVFLAVGYCCLMFTMYVNLGWTPQLITSATGDEALGLTFGTLAPFGGMIGGLLYGVVSLRVGNRVLTIAALGLGVVGSAMLGLTLIGNDTMLWVPARDVGRVRRGDRRLLCPHPRLLRRADPVFGGRGADRAWGASRPCSARSSSARSWWAGCRRGPCSSGSPGCCSSRSSPRPPSGSRPRQPIRRCRRRRPCPRAAERADRWEDDDDAPGQAAG